MLSLPSWGGCTAKRDGWGAERPDTHPTLSSLRADIPPHEGEGEDRYASTSGPRPVAVFATVKVFSTPAR